MIDVRKKQNRCYGYKRKAIVSMRVRMDEKGLIDKVKEIVENDLLGLESGQRELVSEDGVSGLAIEDECVKSANDAESILVNLINSNQKVADRRVGKRIEEFDLIKLANKLDEGGARSHREKGTKAVKGDCGSGMGHQMKEDRGFKDAIDNDNVFEDG